MKAPRTLCCTTEFIRSVDVDRKQEQKQGVQGWMGRNNCRQIRCWELEVVCEEE